MRISRRAGITIAIGSLELLIGVMLIIKAAALFPADRPVVDPVPQTGNDQPERPARSVVNSTRKIAQDLIAPPQVEVSDMERVEPRSPLGELGLAPTPKTPMPQDWRELLLFSPLATSSAGFEAMGRKLTISGVESVGIDRMCLSGASSWPCGQRARAAFNHWLRGRALKCFVPPEVDRYPIAAPCKLDKQDVGAWLVSNGWALALPSGPYGKAEGVARTAGMGIFGPPT